MQRGLFVPGELNNARLGLDSPGPTHNTFGTSQITGRRSPAFSFGATFVHDKKSGVSSSGCGGVGGICSVLKRRFDCLRHRLLGLAQLAMTLASACSSKWMVSIALHQRLSFPRHRVRKGARSSLRYARVVARAMPAGVDSHTCLHAALVPQGFEYPGLASPGPVYPRVDSMGTQQDGRYPTSARTAFGKEVRKLNEVSRTYVL